MAFFKRELGPIERFENALKEKLTARQKLAERLSVAESELAEKRAAAQLCRFRKMRALWMFCAAWMRARSSGVTTPLALALFSRFCTRA